MEKERSVVTGANGHLGNNLVRLLLSEGHQVRATVRNVQNTKPFEGLSCEVCYADLMDKSSMIKAFEGATKVYAVAANFKLWAKDPKKEVYNVNMQGTQNLFEAAAACGVKDIVYVSSIAALNYSQTPVKLENGYNPVRKNWYYSSKNDSEILALSLAKKYNIRTVAVLPSAMIGSESFQMSTSQGILRDVLKGELFVETHFTLNWVDVKDVALGCYFAMQKGRDGERYILANQNHTSITDTVNVAARLYPELKLKKPIEVPKFLLYTVAGLMELVSRVTGKEPLLQRHYVDMFYKVKQDFDISKSVLELGFNPKSPIQTLEEALKYMREGHKY
ncbi:MAG TPA: NAD-dependent epimerase/dehydratase family protein [Cytophagales bacterium]|nr:NAD-dependent epimerase/dehydratase family protein [Cytophagales bacterium]